MNPDLETYSSHLFNTRYTSFVVLLFVLALSHSSVLAGQFNPTRNVGDQVTGWSKLPGTDGKEHSLKDLESVDIVVVVFTCNSCPYAVDYEDRINALAKRFAESKQNAAIIAINSNKIETDLMPAMKKRAEEKAFKFAYLFDESQEVAKQFGAIRTPEFFVLNRERKIVYMGAMDDNTQSDAVTKKYLESAIDAVIAGKPIDIAETAPVGCLIRFERRRK
jgi:peroxiredoxin